MVNHHSCDLPEEIDEILCLFEAGHKGMAVTCLKVLGERKDMVGQLARRSIHLLVQNASASDVEWNLRRALFSTLIEQAQPARRDAQMLFKRSRNRGYQSRVVSAPPKPVYDQWVDETVDDAFGTLVDSSLRGRGAHALASLATLNDDTGDIADVNLGAMGSSPASRTCFGGFKRNETVSHAWVRRETVKERSAELPSSGMNAPTRSTGEREQTKPKLQAHGFKEREQTRPKLQAHGFKEREQTAAGSSNPNTKHRIAKLTPEMIAQASSASAPAAIKASSARPADLLSFIAHFDPSLSARVQAALGQGGQLAFIEILCKLAQGKLTFSERSLLTKVAETLCDDSLKVLEEAGGFIPRLIVRRHQLLKQSNLNHKTGFILSLIDGQTCLDDILELSMLDRGQSTRIVLQLRLRGLVSWL